MCQVWGAHLTKGSSRNVTRIGALSERKERGLRAAQGQSSVYDQDQVTKIRAEHVTRVRAQYSIGHGDAIPAFGRERQEDLGFKKQN